MCRRITLCVQASTKYLHQRLLVVLVSPPLPGIITQHRHGTDNRTSKRHGIHGEEGNESGENMCEEGEDQNGQSSSSSSASESDEYWSDDDPDRESPSRFFFGIWLRVSNEPKPWWRVVT